MLIGGACSLGYRAVDIRFTGNLSTVSSAVGIKKGRSGKSIVKLNIERRVSNLK